MPVLHSVTLQWPFMLWALLALPCFVAGYWILRRRRPQWQNRSQKVSPVLVSTGYVGALLMLAGVAILLFSLTRPRAILLLPGRTEAVMLVMDSSGSMRANDIKPSRFEASQVAARMFIDRQPRYVKLGVVSASGTASVAQAPTLDRDALYRSIDRIALQTGSALGSGLLIGLATLLPASGIPVDQILEAGTSRPNARPGAGGSALGDAPAGAPKVKLEPGSNSAAVIVLMSDGQGNTGPDLLKMAELAADQGVRVFTIGFGTPGGTVLRSGGVQSRVKLDETVLKKVAEVSRGAYFQAATPEDVARIYESLDARIVLQKHQTTEITSLLLILGMCLVLLPATVGIARNGRVL